MRRMNRVSLAVFLALAAGTALSVGSEALAQPALGTNAFTYQGELRSLPGNTLVNGSVNLRFRLFTLSAGGAQVGADVLVNSVQVVDGKFAVATLDFGPDAFAGQERWLEIAVQQGGGAFQTLTPRQRLTPAPGAAYAAKAGAADNATNLGGVGASSYLNTTNATAVGSFFTSNNVARTSVANNFSNAGNQFTGTHSGNGAALTNLSAGAITGVLGDSTLSANVALLNRSPQTFAGANTFSSNATFSARVGVGTGTPSAPIHILANDQQILNLDGNSATGVWLDLNNRAPSGRTWSFISTGAANGEGPGNLLIRDTTALTVPITVLGGSGRIGFGTTNPGAGTQVGQAFDKVEIAGPDVGLRIRNINDSIGGVLWNSFGTLHMGMYNPNAVPVLQVPALARRAFFSVSGGGRVGSTTNTGGEPLFRNLLDDGAGNAGFGTAAPQAQFHVRGPGTFRGNHLAIFENTSAVGGDGIAIQINQNSTNRDNNFVTFYNGLGNVTGRIEGFDLENSDWVNPPPLGNIPALTVNSGVTLRDPSQWFSPGTLPSASFSPGTLPSLSPQRTTVVGVSVVTGFNWDPGTLPSLNFSPGTLPGVTGPTVNIGPGSIGVTNLPTQSQLNDLYCWYTTSGNATVLTFDPVGLATRNAWITAAQLCKDEGVTYGSKGADYAEWLEKADPKEDIRWGMVVGVKGGKISKATKDADQVMVVSRAPIVLGNTPKAGSEGNYEKVGFMGQVHTLVRGKVSVGDYILASDREDGTAIAVAPDSLKPEQLTRVVGRAWSASESDLDFVNVAIGINAHEAARVVARQSAALARLEQENRDMREKLAAFEGRQQRILAALEKLGAMDEPALASSR